MDYQCRFVKMDEKDPTIPAFGVFNLATGAPVQEPYVAENGETKMRDVLLLPTAVERDRHRRNASALAELLLVRWMEEADPAALFSSGVFDFQQRDVAVPMTTSIGVPVNEARLYARWCMGYLLREDMLRNIAADDASLRGALLLEVEDHYRAVMAGTAPILPNPYGVVSLKVVEGGCHLDSLIDLYIAEAEAGGFIPAGGGFAALVALTRALTAEQMANL